MAAKCSASWAQFLIQSGLSRHCSSAMPWMVMTFKWGPTVSVIGLFLPLWSGDLGGSFPNIAIRALFEQHCSMELSGVDIDLGTSTNSNSPKVYLMSISGRRWHTTIILSNRDRSSRHSISFSFEDNFAFFALVFHVQSFRFFIVDQMLTFSDWMRSLTNVSTSVCLMTLWLYISPLMLCSITTLVTILKRSELLSTKGLVKVSIVCIKALTFLSSRDTTAGVWLWCRVWILEATLGSYCNRIVE